MAIAHKKKLNQNKKKLVCRNLLNDFMKSKKEHNLDTKSHIPEWIEETSAACSSIKHNVNIHGIKCLATNEQTIELNGVDYIIEINNEIEKESYSPLPKDIDNVIVQDEDLLDDKIYQEEVIL
ncbi:uncharacterized protein LOC111039506 [Myzus persicae]|uniref:uncharacterized protein LOC111039506 n=1 Tax=Myzus persicae TaxID=13164 RepID=UPI000B931A0A|nr:uncharacterized protein LOC111039506 [Myzus persicae]